MSLADEYKRQYAWRDWPTAVRALPSVEGQTIFDLGCGVGDLAAEFVGRGAQVIGFDLNEQLLHEARSRGLSNAEFRIADLRAFADPGVGADGIWCSFAAAYFTDLLSVLTQWRTYLKPGGWIALTEIDDLFGHQPLGERPKRLLAQYAVNALASGRYDFFMGHKLASYLERAGFELTRTLTLEDREFSFNGPAHPDVLVAWRARLKRMTLLRSFCGAYFDELQREFLNCLMQTSHQSATRVTCCIASKRPEPGLGCESSGC